MTRPVRHVALVLLPLIGVLPACGGASPVAPSPTSQVAGPSLAGLEIVGAVRDTSTWPCVGCRVEVLDGPRAGTATMTDKGGGFFLRVPGPVSLPLALRATGDGYHPATRIIESLTPSLRSSSVSVSFELQALAPSRNLNGTFALRVEAYRGCSELPVVARQRTYRVTLASSSSHPTFYRATPVEGSFLSFHFYVAVAGDFVGVDTDTDLYGDGITEELTPPASVQIWGWGGATATGRSIVVPFGGEISYCPAPARQPNGFWGCAVTPTVCESQEHQWTLTPS